MFGAVVQSVDGWDALVSRVPEVDEQALVDLLPVCSVTCPVELIKVAPVNPPQGKRPLSQRRHLGILPSYSQRTISGLSQRSEKRVVCSKS